MVTSGHTRAYSGENHRQNPGPEESSSGANRDPLAVQNLVPSTRPRQLDVMRIVVAGAILLPVCCWILIGLHVTFSGTLPLLGVLMLMTAVPLLPFAKRVLLETWTHRRERSITTMRRTASEPHRPKASS